MVYTGIVQQTGTAYYDETEHLCVDVEESFWFGAKSGFSVCVDGVCLTLVGAPEGRIGRFYVMKETKSITTLGSIVNSTVNLERSLQYGHELGGHVVTGHVNGKGKISKIIMNGDLSYDIWFELCKRTLPGYPIKSKGSITCNGISLTVADLKVNKKSITSALYVEETTAVSCRISITPYTFAHTTIKFWKIGDFINLEYDTSDRNSSDYQTESRNDEFYMMKAIKLGEKGRLTAPPNPWVGCIIVGKTGKILGKGYHHKAGEPHAEVNAIKDAESKFGEVSTDSVVNGATAYVTLEPCNHHGRTPPCTDLLISKGIKRVVVAYADPDHRVAGTGIERLKENNIKVDVGVCHDLVAESLRPYFKQRERKRPYCIAKAAISMDGKICCGDGTSQWITGEQAREDAHQTLRRFSQAILIGASTAVIDEPRLTVRSASNKADVQQPLRVIVDTRGRVIKGPLLDTTIAKTVIFTSHLVNENSKRIWEKNGVEYVITELNTDQTLNLNCIFDTLASKFGIIQLLVEGGSVLQGELLKQGLIDEFILYQGSCLIGKNGKHWCNTSICNTISNADFWELIETKQLGMDVRLKYRKQPSKMPKIELEKEQISFTPMEQAIEKFSKGGFVIVMDNEDRENEGDLIIAAEHATPEKLTFMVNHGTGIICVPMPKERAKHLELPLMIDNNEDPKKTAFTVSCDSKITSTGVSAIDRSTTITLLASNEAKASDFTRPGHIFPLISVQGGLLSRQGHTEAAVELCKLANKTPVAAIVEIVNKNGTMARLGECQQLSKEYDIPIITVQQIIDYLLTNRNQINQPTPAVQITRVSECNLPITVNDKIVKWKLVGYSIQIKNKAFTQTALILGDLSVSNERILTRIHSECFTGDVFGSARCDCGEQLKKSIELISNNGKGIIIHVSGHEGRGIGLLNKIKAYRLLDENPKLNTFEANNLLGFDDDLRNYEIPLAILSELNIKSILLITNNPEKFNAFSKIVAEVVPVQVTENENNRPYLEAKKNRANNAHSFGSMKNISIQEEPEQGSSVSVKKSSPLDFPAEIGENIGEIKIGIISTLWNIELVDSLRTQTEEILLSFGVNRENITNFQVPGAWELPWICKKLAQTNKYDVIICMGVLLKGETHHFERISEAVARGLMKIQIQQGIPVLNGVLNCLTISQAEDRCGIHSILPRSLACSLVKMACLKLSI